LSVCQLRELGADIIGGLLQAREALIESTGIGKGVFKVLELAPSPPPRDSEADGADEPDLGCCEEEAKCEPAELGIQRLLL
jgi:hypothetical protein